MRVTNLMGRKILVFCRRCEKKREEKGEDQTVVVNVGYRRFHLIEDHGIPLPPMYLVKYYDPAEVQYYRRHHEDDWDGRSSKANWKPRHPGDALEKRIKVICLVCEREGRDVVVLPGNKRKHLLQRHMDKVKDPQNYNHYYESALVKYYRRHPEDEWDKNET